MEQSERARVGHLRQREHCAFAGDSTPGTYVLRLTATDSVFTVSDDVVITVNPDPVPPPPDPATIAPPIDNSVVTTIGSATSFLYSGPNPIQTGVAAGVIKMERVEVVRGRVLDKNGSPLSKVKITVLDHPELGQTLSRADGMFDIAVNGGGLLTLNYEKLGFMPLQRKDDVPWQDFVMLPDVVMMSYDPQVTLVDLSANIPMQVAQGSVMTDDDGARRSTLLFAQGTTATIQKSEVSRLQDISVHPYTLKVSIDHFYRSSRVGDLMQFGPSMPLAGPHCIDLFSVFAIR